MLDMKTSLFLTVLHHNLELITTLLLVITTFDEFLH